MLSEGWDPARDTQPGTEYEGYARLLQLLYVQRK